MQPAGLSPHPAPLAAKQREALVSLLADEDPAIYRLVRSQLLAYGPAVSAWLRPHALSDNPLMRRRVAELLQHLARQEADERFLAFCHRCGEELDLEEAAILLARTEYPEAQVEPYQALFDAWAGEVRERIGLAGEPEHVLAAVNRYLFGELGLAGSPDHAQEPESGYLNRVVDRRCGSPVCLGAVYLFVARRLRLPVAGIGLPGRFVCRYQSSRKEFYIDPYQQGRFLSKADCVQYLIRNYRGLAEGVLAPVSPRRILLRMCSNLEQAYTHREKIEPARRLHRYVMALTR